mgnify:CR=1 FL=1
MPSSLTDILVQHACDNGDISLWSKLSLLNKDFNKKCNESKDIIKKKVLKTIEHRCTIESDLAKAKLELPAKQYEPDRLKKLQEKAKGQGLECRNLFQ